MIKNEAAVVASLREGLKDYSSVLRVSFRKQADIREELPGLVEGLMDAAMAETGEADEGDYIRYHNTGYSYKTIVEREKGGWRYTIEIRPDYLTYHEYALKTEERIGEIMASFAFSSDTTDIEKIRAVYDHIYENVRYDKVHRKNPYHRKRSTAYAALVQGEATCQGYALALYRLLMEAGVETRIVTGTVSGPYGEALHAWNKVRTGGRWYHLDASWEAVDGGVPYRYFMSVSQGDRRVRGTGESRNLSP